MSFKMEAISTRQQDGWAPIHVAAANGHESVIGILLENAAFVDFPTSRGGESPLFLAAQNGHAGVVAQLLDRGARAEAPENTLAALRRAAELGAPWVEFDVKLSADGELLLMHDDLLDRTTSGEGPVADMRWNRTRLINCSTSSSTNSCAATRNPRERRVTCARC